MKTKRILTAVLAVAMMLASLSICANAQETGGQISGTDNNGTSTEANPLDFDAEDVLKDASAGENYSTVYYGGIPWKVLDKEFSVGQEDGKTGIYLLSEYAYGYGTFWNAHYGPGDYVWNRIGIFTRLDVLYHPEGYQGNPGNTHPTNLGYQASDIRKYMTGIGDYEAVYPRSMHEHGNPDDSGLNVSSYFWKTKATETEPVPGVEYYVKGEFKLSTDSNNCYKTLAVTAEDWLPDTWYTYDEATDTYNLVEEAPAEGETLICYHDATEYYKVGELDSFEDGVDYYTFEKISAGMPEWEYTKLEMQSNSIAKGALYCAFTVTDMKESTSADVEGEGRVILSGENNRSFASDMGFSELEQSLVLPVNRVGYTNGAAKTPSTWTYKNSGAYSDEFVNDTYFLPTAADLNTYLKANGLSLKTTFANGDSAQYWLSSMLRYDRAGMVDGGGGEWYQHPTYKALGIRPAFVLDSDAVYFYAPIDDDEFANIEDTNEYKIVLAKDDAKEFTAELVEFRNNKAIVNYSNADAGKNNYFTAMFKDGDGNIAAYGEVSAVDSENGTVEVDFSNLENYWGLDLYIFNEERNGGTEINYASEIVYVGTPQKADSIEVAFELASEDEGEKVYNIVLKSEEKIINRLNSVDLTFVLEQIEGTNEYEIIASNPEVVINPVNNSKDRYEFHYDGKTDVETDTSQSIIIGQVKFTGYGKFSFAVDADSEYNVAHATTIADNIVDTFIPGGDITAGEGNLDISDDTISDVVISVPVRNLTINVDFPNAVVDNAIAYQDMKIVISGSDIDDITIDLGSDAEETPIVIFGQEEAKYVAEFVDGSYVINVTDALTVNNAYTVTVSGAGYRTARYTVTMTEDKTLNFWNNVKDNAVEVEEDKASSAKNVTFLAGDIVKDSTINIYDLSAVVSYFGEIDLNVAGTANAYPKYDLNRDGKIDSKDVAYVLVSWNN